MSANDLAQDVRAALRDYPDFPEQGILFRDIMPLFADPALLGRLVDWFVGNARERSADVLVGIESRGLLFGVPAALRLDLPFVAARKAGKLPGETRRIDYALEYGTATVEIQSDSIRAGDQVYIVDDLLATGGTAAATAELCQSMGARVAGVGCVIELEALSGRNRLGGLHQDYLLSL